MIVLSVAPMNACVDAPRSTSVGNQGSPETGVTDATVTENVAGEMASLLSGHCLRCHDGTSALLPLATLDDLAANRERIVSEIVEGRMPPWKVDAACNTYSNVSSLSDRDMAVVRAWSVAGYPMPEPSDLRRPSVESVGDATRLALSAHTSASFPDGSGEMVVCQQFGMVGDADIDVVASAVVGSAVPFIHHMNVHGVLPQNAAATPCASQDVPIGGVGPGTPRFVTPAGTGIRLPAGTRIEAMVHYARTEIYEASSGLLPQIELWKADDDVRVRPLTALGVNAAGFVIPAGEPDVRVTESVALPFSGRVVAVVPHMHELGRTIRVDLVSGTGGAGSCLVDVTSWQFRRQEYYLLDEPGGLPFAVGDLLRVACSYDNSSSNQPEAGGQRREPRDVEYGNFTTDEMCQASLWVLRDDE
jgi:hypothetical protein